MWVCQGLIYTKPRLPASQHPLPSPSSSPQNTATPASATGHPCPTPTPSSQSVLIPAKHRPPSVHQSPPSPAPTPSSKSYVRPASQRHPNVQQRPPMPHPHLGVLPLSSVPSGHDDQRLQGSRRPGPKRCQIGEGYARNGRGLHGGISHHRGLFDLADRQRPGCPDALSVGPHLREPPQGVELPVAGACPGDQHDGKPKLHNASSPPGRILRGLRSHRH